MFYCCYIFFLSTDSVLPNIHSGGNPTCTSYLFVSIRTIFILRFGVSSPQKIIVEKWVAKGCRKCVPGGLSLTRKSE